MDIQQVESILPQLMEWLQNINWPVAQPLSRALAEYGTILVPHIKSVLKSLDPQWQFSVMVVLIRELPKDVSAVLEEDLLRLALHPTEGEIHEELHILAQETLEHIKQP